jgi:hypothetical protein
MNRNEMYQLRPQTSSDPAERIALITSLCLVGAAACESSAGVQHLENGMQALFEVIYSLSGEAGDILETQERAKKAAATV